MSNGRYAEKRLLEETIPKLDSDISKRLTTELIDLRDDLRTFSRSPGDFEIQIKTIKDESCFRLVFSLPVLLHFHRSTTNLREIHQYHKSGQHTFIAGFFPAYNCNLNHLTLLKLYNQRAFQWMEDMSENDDEDYYCCMFNNNRGDKMTQSCLNFLLQNDAVLKPLNDNSSNMINRCFELNYWRLPSEFKEHHSAIYGMIYHRATRINKMTEVYKTVLKIVSLDNKRYVMGVHQTIRYVHATVYLMIRNDDGSFCSLRKKLFISEPDASRLNPNDVAVCLIEVASFPRNKTVPIIHAIIGNKITQDDLAIPISLSVWKRLNELPANAPICKICVIEDLKQDVRLLMKENSIVFTDTDDSEFEARFKNSIETTYPLIFEYDGSVYHAASPLISYLLVRNLPFVEKKGDLVNFLKFIDTIDPKVPYKNKMKLRTSKYAANIQSDLDGNQWNSIMMEIPRVINRIMYSRVFSRYRSRFN